MPASAGQRKRRRGQQQVGTGTGPRNGTSSKCPDAGATAPPLCKRPSPAAAAKANTTVVADAFQRAQMEILDHQQQPSTSTMGSTGCGTPMVAPLRARNHQIIHSASDTRLCQREGAQDPPATRKTSLDDLNPRFRVHPPSEPHLETYRAHVPALPNAAWANTHTVWNLLCWKDGVYQPTTHYLRRHPEITEQMRAILFDWMAEVCEVYKLHRETYYLAIDIFERFLAKSPGNIVKSRLQLIGVTTLFIAAKIEEIYPPKIHEFAYVTDGACRESEIKQVELIILKTIGWALCPVTPVHWLAVYLQVAENHLNLQSQSQSASPVPMQTDSLSASAPDVSSVTSNSSAGAGHFKRQLFPERPPTVDCVSLPKFHRQTFASICQLLDLAVLDAGWSQFSAGVLAAGAIYCMANRSAIACEISGYTETDLAACVQFLRPFAAVCTAELPEPTIKLYPNVHPDDMHNIQTHTVGMAQLSLVQQQRVSLGLVQLTSAPKSDPHTPKLHPGTGSHPAFPTPPDSGYAGSVESGAVTRPRVIQVRDASV